MTAISHNEIRRHPRWREEVNAPPSGPTVRPVRHRAVLVLIGAGALVALALLFARLLKG
jgi:hypothetical protein